MVRIRLPLPLSAKWLRKRQRALKPLAIGDVAAFVPVDRARPLTDLAFRDIDGETSLSELKGKTILMNLWATWCVPCREEMPALDELEAEMGSDDFEVVAVNIDTGSDEKPVRFMDEIGISSLAFYRDETMGTFNTLKKDGLAFGLPSTLLIDENGCLLGSMNGPAEWASDDAKALVTAAIGGTMRTDGVKTRSPAAAGSNQPKGRLLPAPLPPMPRRWS